MGLFGGSNSFFSKPFGTGEGSVSEFFGGSNKKVGSARHKVTGFDPDEVASFQKATSSLASAKKRVDLDTFAPKEKTISVTTKERNRQVQEGSPLSIKAEQMEGFVAAFTQRQDEVFRRRAKPGIAQTRLV